MDALISKEEYLSYAKEYEDRISVLQEKIQHLNRKVEEEAKMQAESDQWITEFKNHINLEELTYDVVRGLIEQIEVNQDGSINIFYRFGKH